MQTETKPEDHPDLKNLTSVVKQLDDELAKKPGGFTEDRLNQMRRNVVGSFISNKTAELGKQKQVLAELESQVKLFAGAIEETRKVMKIAEKMLGKKEAAA